MRSRRVWVVLLAAVCVGLLLSRNLRTPRSVKRKGRPAKSTVHRAHTPERNAPEPERPPTDPFASVDLARDLHGVVVRKSDGRPVGGALLTVFFDGWYDYAIPGAPAVPAREAGPTTRSAADGSFVIPLEVPRRYVLRVEKEGFATAEWKLLRRGERVRLELEEGREFAVRVVDPRKAPVAGAHVRLEFSKKDHRQRCELEGTTDESGQVAWSHVSAFDWLHIRFDHAELGSSATNRSAPFDQPLVIEYPEGRTVRGVVLDAETRRPIPGARVTAWIQSSGSAESDEQGRFEYRGWAPRRSDLLRVEADGYAIGGVNVGEAEQVEVTLSKGGTVVGRLVDPAGQPVAGARCILASMARIGRDSVTQQRRSVSDADGRIRFEGVCRSTSSVDRSHKLYVSAEGHARLFHRFESHFRPNPHDLGELTLAEPHALVVTVTRAGAPLADLKTWLIGPLAEGERFSNGVPQPMALTDGGGVARYDSLAPGRYRFMIRIDGAPGFAEEVEVTEREQHRDVKLVVGRELKVTVVDEAGAPVHEYLSLSAQHDGEFLNCDVGSDGTATLYLWPEVREVVLRDLRNRDPTSWTKHAIDAEQTELRIVHAVRVPIRGVVVREDGSVVEQPRLRAIRGAEWAGDNTGSSKGEFRLHVTPGTPVHIDAMGHSADGRQFLLGSVDDVAVGATDLRIVVREPARDRTLLVRALAPDGSPLVGVRVGSLYGDAVTGEDGIGKLDTLFPMAAEFGGSDPQCRFGHPPPIVAVPRGQTVELRFRPGATVRVRVLEDGKPVAGAQCFVYNQQTRIDCRTDDDGWVRFVAVKGVAERFNMSVHHAGKQYNQLGIGADDDGESFDIRKMTYR